MGPERATVGSHILRLVRHSAVYGIGHIITRALGFLLLPLYTNTIPPGEFGKAALIFSFLAIMNVFYGYGMDVAFLRYVALQDDERKQRELFSTAFWSLLLTSLAFSVLIFTLKSRISVLIFGQTGEERLIELSAGILLFDALALIPFMALRAREKSVPFVVLKLANVLVNVGANIWFIVLLKRGVEGIFLANLLSSSLTFFFLAPVWLRFLTFYFGPGDYREMLRFGLPYIPSGLAVVAIDLIDRFILEKLTDIETTGLYSAGYKLGMFMALFIAAFRFAWHPFFLSTSKQPNAKEIFARILTYFVLACSLVFLVISFFIDEIVRFNLFGITLFGREYWQSTSIVPLILLSYVFYGIYVNFLIGIYLEKKTHWLPFITGAATLINIASNLLLIPWLGMMGSAWATVLAYGSMALILYLKVRPIYPVPYEWGRLVHLSIWTAFIFFAQRYLLPPAVSIKSLLLVAYIVGLFLTGFFKRQELAYLRVLWSKWRK
jgi:O-antigen/teichoic acid export membrane protein